jgi:hypothetical protein
MTKESILQVIICDAGLKQKSGPDGICSSMVDALPARLGVAVEQEVGCLLQIHYQKAISYLK